VRRQKLTGNARRGAGSWRLQASPSLVLPTRRAARRF